MTIVGLVRGNLSKLNRATLSALVVMDVHARDTVEMMAKEGVCNITDFAWLSQVGCNPAVACSIPPVSFSSSFWL